MKYFIFILLAISLLACAPKVATKFIKTYPPLDYKEEVTILSIAEEIPTSATEIGMIKVGDSGFSTDCGYDVAVKKAIEVARKSGGNVLKIIEHKPPSVLGSSCDRITFKILKVENLTEIKNITAKRNEVVDSTWNYAKLYVYRQGGVGAFVGYDLYLGDQVICRVKSNTKQEIKITKKGMHSLWAKTESKSEIPIDIEFGKEYYVRCSMVMGVMVGRPKLQLVDRMQGKLAYQKIKGK